MEFLSHLSAVKIPTPCPHIAGSIKKKKKQKHKTNKLLPREEANKFSLKKKKNKPPHIFSYFGFMGHTCYRIKSKGSRLILKKNIQEPAAQQYLNQNVYSHYFFFTSSNNLGTQHPPGII